MTLKIDATTLRQYSEDINKVKKKDTGTLVDTNEGDLQVHT
jgi:hypothetical protein